MVTLWRLTVLRRDELRTGWLHNIAGEAYVVYGVRR